MIKRLLLVALILITIPAFAHCVELHIVNYNVEDGETLDSIALKYVDHPMEEKEWLEFREGIIENNYETIFKYRNYVQKGDKLEIRYFS